MQNTKTMYQQFRTAVTGSPYSNYLIQQMRNLKIDTFRICCICLAMLLSAQTGLNAQNVFFGLTGGTSFSNYRITKNTDLPKSKSLTGLTFGLQASLKTGKHILFQPAVNYIQKGTWDESTAGGAKLKATMKVNQIEVPLMVSYTSHGFFLGAGPSFGFNLSGKLKVESSLGGSTEKLTFGQGPDDVLRKFDPALNFTAGYLSTKGFLVAVNYNRGIIQLNPNNAGEGKLYSTYTGIRIGYLIAKH